MVCATGYWPSGWVAYLSRCCWVSWMLMKFSRASRWRCIIFGLLTSGISSCNNFDFLAAYLWPKLWYLADKLISDALKASRWLCQDGIFICRSLSCNSRSLSFLSFQRIPSSSFSVVSLVIQSTTSSEQESWEDTSLSHSSLYGESVRCPHFALRLFIHVCDDVH